MPPAAKKLSNSKESGKFIPKVLVTSADGSEPIGSVTYETLYDDARKAARAMKKKVAAKLAEAPAEVVVAKNPLLAEEQEWTNDQGKTIRAAVVRVDGEEVEFLIKRKKVSYPLNKLSEESAAKLKDLMK